MVHQLTIICGLFNQKVNRMRERAREGHYEWEESSQESILPQ